MPYWSATVTTCTDTSATCLSFFHNCPITHAIVWQFDVTPNKHKGSAEHADDDNQEKTIATSGREQRTLRSGRCYLPSRTTTGHSARLDGGGVLEDKHILTRHRRCSRDETTRPLDHTTPLDNTAPNARFWSVSVRLGRECFHQLSDDLV